LKENINSKPILLHSRKEIETIVARLSNEIIRDYAGKCPLLIGVLKGSFIFLSDLVRRLDFPLEIEFVRLSSYGSGLKSSGKIKMLQDMQSPIKGRDLLIVEDIIDSGQSLVFLCDYLQKKGPASLKLVCLLDKPSRRTVPVTIDYCGIKVPDKFLVGYGLDYAEQYRNLPDICYLEESRK
jgi:hypoxanthine phosphoribosyltransferase